MVLVPFLPDEVDEKVGAAPESGLEGEAALSIRNCPLEGLAHWRALHHHVVVVKEFFGDVIWRNLGCDLEVGSTRCSNRT